MLLNTAHHNVHALIFNCFENFAVLIDSASLYDEINLQILLQHNNGLFIVCYFCISVIQQNGGFEYIIAPIWKRFAAETIDVLILFIIKIMAAFLIIDIFDFDL